MRLFPLYSCFVLSLVVPNMCYRLFDSRDPVVDAIIEQCVSEIPDKKVQCYNILRCIIDNVPSEFSARWSSGASILAFIPTITALLSNSINEVSSIADESILLAVTLSLSSVTAFNYRFRDKTNTPSDPIFTKPSVGSDRPQAAWAKLESVMSNTEKKGPIPWWLRWNTCKYAMCLILFALSASIWYEVYQTTKHGIVTFACPVKVNVSIWAGLSQFLTLLNVGFRHCAFDTRIIHFRSREVELQTRQQATIQSPSTGGGQQPVAPSTDGTQGASTTAIPTMTRELFTLILRSPSNQTLRWLLQTFTALASFTLYTYGTVILASMTLIPASDAVRAMTVLAIGAGFARLVGHWAMSPSRKGNRVFVIDLPPGRMEDFHNLVLKQARIRISTEVPS